jgi:DNA-directed RNA polymerase specialized sigma subunit
MTAKEYLRQARCIELKLKCMAEQLVSLQSAAVYVSPAVTCMPRPATPNVHLKEDAVVRVMEMENALHDEFNKLADIHKAINAVSDPVRHAILVKRYISGAEWNAIAVALGISVSRVHQIHTDALKDIEKAMPIIPNCI